MTGEDERTPKLHASPTSDVTTSPAPTTVRAPIDLGPGARRIPARGRVVGGLRMADKDSQMSPKYYLPP